jgi:hypothetical protein
MSYAVHTYKTYGYGIYKIVPKLRTKMFESYSSMFAWEKVLVQECQNRMNTT